MYVYVAANDLSKRNRFRTMRNLRQNEQVQTKMAEYDQEGQRTSSSCAGLPMRQFSLKTQEALSCTLEAIKRAHKLASSSL